MSIKNLYGDREKPYMDIACDQLTNRLSVTDRANSDVSQIGDLIYWGGTEWEIDYTSPPFFINTPAGYMRFSNLPQIPAQSAISLSIEYNDITSGKNVYLTAMSNGDLVTNPLFIVSLSSITSGSFIINIANPTTNNLTPSGDYTIYFLIFS